MAVITVTHRERPQLWDRLPALFDGVWPEYGLHGDVIPAYWQRLFDDCGRFQIVLYDDATDDVLATARSVPCAWDGTTEGLGPGIDAAIVTAFAQIDEGVAPNALCALGVEVAPAHQGRSLATVALQALVSLARADGLQALIVPLRPTLKERYPLTPIERYMAWTRHDGTALDPWIRTHTRMGATIAAAAPESSSFTGTVAEWESWTGMAFPDDGAYVFPGGLSPLDIDHRRDLGSYWEPNVWMIHAVTP